MAQPHGVEAMGETAENIVNEHGFSRAEQDALRCAARSVPRARWRQGCSTSNSCR
jgi:acetyl-CoA acetyltransferase